jgi:hypothetical protein
MSKLRNILNNAGKSSVVNFKLLLRPNTDVLIKKIRIKMNVPFQKDDLITRPKIIHRLAKPETELFYIFPNYSKVTYTTKYLPT